LNDEKVGLYSVGYNLTQQLISMSMTTVNLAAMPIIMREYNKASKSAVNIVLKKYFILLLTFSFPLVIALWILNEDIASVFLGDNFQENVIRIIPIITIGILLSGIRSYYFDLSYQLEKKTNYLVWIILIAAIINIAGNFYLIPVYGIDGAAYATVLAYLISFILSIAFGRKIYMLVFPIKEIIKIFTASFIMIIVWQVFEESQFFVKVLLGVVVYSSFYFILNVNNISTKFYIYYNKKKGKLFIK
jgi:O-antigen/teichoic acid export membrane protein